MRIDEITEIPWIDTPQSSVIAAFKRDDTGDLLIRFKSGKVYRYKNFKSSEMHNMRRVASKGKFMHRRIIGGPPGPYNYKRVE